MGQKCSPVEGITRPIAAVGERSYWPAAARCDRQHLSHKCLWRGSGYLQLLSRKSHNRPIDLRHVVDCYSSAGAKLFELCVQPVHSRNGWGGMETSKNLGVWLWF